MIGGGGVLWHVTPCRWMVPWIIQPLKIKALCSFETSGNTEPQRYLWKLSLLSVELTVFIGRIV